MIKGDSLDSLPYSHTGRGTHKNERNETPKIKTALTFFPAASIRIVTSKVAGEKDKIFLIVLPRIACAMHEHQPFLSYEMCQRL